MADTKNHNHVRGRKENEEPNPVDIHIGRRIRLRRQNLGYSQQFMARRLGLTFQQIQKYEKGVNRIGGSRLWDVSRVLQTTPNFFFADMDEETREQSPMMLSAPDIEMENEFIEASPADPMNRKETLELVNSYYRIKNRQLALSLLAVLKMMASGNSTFPSESETDVDCIRADIEKLLDFEPGTRKPKK